MAFTTNFMLPPNAITAFMEAYPGKSTYVALRDRCVKAGFDDRKIKLIAHEKNLTITAVCRKILIKGKPGLEAAWPEPKPTPRQLNGYHKRSFAVEKAPKDPIINDAARLLRAMMLDPDNGHTRRNIRRWLKDHAGIERPKHNDTSDLPTVEQLDGGEVLTGDAFLNSLDFTN